MTENRPTTPIASDTPSTSSRVRAAWRILRHGCLYGQPWWEFENCPRCTGINYCVCKPASRLPLPSWCSTCGWEIGGDRHISEPGFGSTGWEGRAVLLPCASCGRANPPGRFQDSA